MDRRRTVELDWAADPAIFGGDADEHGTKTAARLGLQVERVGEANGWPVLRFSGPDEAVDQLVAEYSHDLEDVDGDRFFYDVRLTNDEAEAIGADGRDGRGDLVAGNLTDREYLALEAYREVVDLLPKLPPHEADVLRDDVVELSDGTISREDFDRDVAWAREALAAPVDRPDDPSLQDTTFDHSDPSNW